MICVFFMADYGVQGLLCYVSYCVYYVSYCVYYGLIVIIISLYSHSVCRWLNNGAWTATNGTQSIDDILNLCTQLLKSHLNTFTLKSDNQHV